MSDKGNRHNNVVKTFAAALYIAWSAEADMNCLSANLGAALPLLCVLLGSHYGTNSYSSQKRVRNVRNSLTRNAWKTSGAIISKFINYHKQN